MSIFPVFGFYFNDICFDIEGVGIIIPYLSTILENLHHNKIENFSISIHKLINLIRQNPQLLKCESGKILNTFFLKMRFLFHGIGNDISIKVSSNRIPEMLTETPSLHHVNETLDFIDKLQYYNNMKQLMNNL